MPDFALPARVKTKWDGGSVNAPSVRKELYIIPSAQIIALPMAANDGTAKYTGNCLLRPFSAAVPATATTAAIPELVAGKWTLMTCSEAENDFSFETIGEDDNVQGYKFEAKYTIYGVEEGLIGFLASLASLPCTVVVFDRNNIKWLVPDVSVTWKATFAPKNGVTITIKPIGKYGLIYPPRRYDGSVELR